MTNNVPGADNQQERPLSPDWITGFVDGEGCFSIGFIHQHGGFNRTGYKTGYQVAHEFVVTQGAKSVECLLRMQVFFGVGQVTINRRHDNHKEPMYRFVVRKRDDLTQVITPFFTANPLQTAKQLDFQKFVRCLQIINQNGHLTTKGLIEIANIVETMNRHKSKRVLVGILRDYTPDAATAVKI